VGPLLAEMLDEYGGMSERLAGAGFPSDSVNQLVKWHQALGFEVRELLFQACAGHKLFVRALERPSRTDRSRIAPDPVADEIERAMAAVAADDGDAAPLDEPQIH
jgi:hypothetical protein